MAEYRKFRLKNSNNEYYDLANSKQKHFLYSPAGLGFSGQTYGYRFRNRKYVKETEFELPTVSGTMVFHADTIEENYALYYDFMSFIEHTPLEIYYLTPQNPDNWNYSKYAECDAVQIDKTETDQETPMLRAPIKFECRTFWRDKTIKTYTAKPGITGDQLQIPMTFPFWFGLDSLRGIVIYNDGTVEAPLTVEIKGSCVNPTYKLFDENGVEYGACKLDGTFSSVKVETDTETITLKRNGVVLSNPAKYEDLTIGNLDQDDYYLTFLSLKPGKNLMTASLGSSFSGSVVFSWRDEWISI